MPVSKKLEIVTLVNRSPVSKRDTLRELGMAHSTFYRWQKRYRAQGEVGLVDRRPEPGSVWNRLRPAEQEMILAEALLANKANVNARNNAGTEPLQFAAQEGHKEVVQVLMSHKADVNAKSNDGQRPLHAAALNGHADLVSLLLANGAEVNAKENHGLTALDDAVGRGHSSTVKQLLANKADVNTTTSNGLTPLDHAAAMGGKAVAELLLASGADINAKPSGHTALQYAEESHHDDVAALLRQHGGRK
jgi:ankyrin repeat protein